MTWIRPCLYGWVGWGVAQPLDQHRGPIYPEASWTVAQPRTKLTLLAVKVLCCGAVPWIPQTPHGCIVLVQGTGQAAACWCCTYPVQQIIDVELAVLLIWHLLGGAEHGACLDTTEQHLLQLRGLHMRARYQS